MAIDTEKSMCRTSLRDGMHIHHQYDLDHIKAIRALDGKLSSMKSPM